MRTGRLATLSILVLAWGFAADSTLAQRERTRPRPRGSTSVSQAQASELTLTVTEVAVRPIQVWVRTAGVLDDDQRTLTASVSATEGASVRTGQRVRAFSPASVSRMNQGTVSSVAPRGRDVIVTVELAGRTADPSRYYVLEIVTEAGEFPSVPNEAILESGGRQVVYVQAADGSYAPRELTVGVRGELFTQVLDGVKPGEQVVTIGSFFIDAEHRLKAF